ncbi:putative serine/threonine-protein kinase KIN1 like protein [Nosema granulosis]|uniref:Serine/threonine-protein kinase KIN1 like protein n=1 Tax=Nosema granulosis TaxID=83296 RepID=A0A9P6H1S4_9MICR|nr:putative serine/threonine-protein kinase KIN1 like protein [Nosema granulosis]
MILDPRYSKLDKDLESLMDSSSVSMQTINEFGKVEDDEYVEDKYLKHFRIVRSLGSGSSSKVVLGINTENNEKVAIKIVPRRFEDLEFSPGDKTGKADIRIFRETIMSVLISHPYIARLKDFLYSHSHFFLIFEYIKGKQMYDLIVNEGELDEREARRYFRQLVSAIDYIHRNSIVHRDLKIENILVDEHGNVKLIDFGLSNFYDNKMLLNTFCGSLYFAAPELLMGHRYCGPEIDIWSLGVVLYVLLNGCVPFDDKDVVNLQGKIKEADFEFKKHLSEEVKQLILGMLQPNPSSRFTLDHIISSAWLNEGYDTTINSFFVRRYPLRSLHNNHLRVLATAMSFQFRNLEREVLRYYNICASDNETLEQIYWSKRPVISLYYLLEENLTDKRGSEEVDYITNINKSDRPEIINRFVNYVLSREKKSPCSKFFKTTVFKKAEQPVPPASASLLRLNEHPRIRNTYIKGFFKGIKVKYVGSHNALKKILVDIFRANRIKYEVTDKYFFCSVFVDDVECYFKVGMYFNMLFSDYYIGVHFLNGDRSLFKQFQEQISNTIRKRTVVC